tara:strand:- start:4692 stop:5975 length:1284 start_codon:yes stop_codon:yes gene_type:complete
MQERIAVVSGYRTPFLRASTDFKALDADDLAAYVIKHVMLLSGISTAAVDEVVLGNVAQPSKAANVSRVAALKAGFEDFVPAYTVQRNCASGMESVSTAINKILVGKADTIVAGGTESMTNIPFLFSRKMKSFFENLMKAKTPMKKLAVLASFKVSYLAPVIGLVDGLTDPICGQIMGITAENLAKEFSITRLEQDEYALHSHQKALAAQESDFFKQEIIPVRSGFESLVDSDNGPRGDQTLEKLQKLKPYFDRRYGTVTVGNACPITDGAAAMILKRESAAKRDQDSILGYIRDYDYAGLEPSRMGLGPVYATAKLFKRTGISLADIDAIEMNEAFAAQIIANLRAFESDSFAKTFLGLDKALGEVNMDTFNIHGGAIALGHPVGATGARLLITLLHTLKKINKQRGLATLCVGGGQGASFIVEVD